MGVEHGFDAVYRHVDAAGDLAVGGFDLARAGGDFVELRRQPRTVGAKRLQLRAERLLAPVGVAAALDRGFQCVQRLRKTLGRRLDRGSLSAMGQIPGCRFPVSGISCIGKRLDREPYVLPHRRVNLPAKVAPCLFVSPVHGPQLRHGLGLTHLFHVLSPPQRMALP